MRAYRLLVLPAASLIGLAACSDKKNDTPSAAAGPITVTATDSACEVSARQANAGTVTFKVTNKGTKVTEFYVYAAGDRIMGEVENVAPGLARDLHVELPAGTYETACKPGMTGKGIRTAFTVSGSAQPLTVNAKLADATDSYQRYVRSQTGALLEKTQRFVDAVKAGDVAKAKALYPVARTY